MSYRSHSRRKVGIYYISFILRVIAIKIIVAMWFFGFLHTMKLFLLTWWLLPEIFYPNIVHRARNPRFILVPESHTKIRVTNLTKPVIFLWCSLITSSPQMYQKFVRGITFTCNLHYIELEDRLVREETVDWKYGFVSMVLLGWLRWVKMTNSRDQLLKIYLISEDEEV